MYRFSRLPALTGLAALSVLSLYGSSRAAHAQDAETHAMLTSQMLPMNLPGGATAVWAERVGLGNMNQDWGTPAAGKTVDGAALKLKGVVYPHGIGTHAKSELVINLNRNATRFLSMVGLDDERAGQGSIVFQIYVDGKEAYKSPVMHGGDEPRFVDINLTGAKTMTLIVDDGDGDITNDHGDWAGALIVLKPGAPAPKSAGVPVEPPPNIHHETSPIPAIHGPRIYGSTPGRPFLYLIPATGKGPLTYAAKNLPAGLKLDSKTGIITGSLQADGRTVVDLTVKGPMGTGKRKFTIVGGKHKLALTPALGWNSWNVWAGAVDEAKTRDAADAMIKSTLAAHGFQYVNIDDTWEAERDANGEILSNKKFPDMKALCDYVHSKGLKIGIYSSPGPKTCANFEASYKHEVQDAMTWAKWGFDYIKHDWCSYGGVATGEGRERFVRPYRWMREALDKTNRDILYSLCQYGMGNVWEWGDSDEVKANSWRTTGDINDSWGSLQSIAFSQDGHEKFAGPGHWNDPDMLVVGKVGWGPNIHPTKLTPNEQILHISMWCLQSSPLLIGCDMTAMDPFTLDLLTNDEVLDVNQDPLGKPAGRKSQDGQLEVWARPLHDGTMAVGLFNRSVQAAKVTAKWSDLGLKGKQPVRDLWLWKNLGSFDGAFATTVPAHGCILVKIGKPKPVD